MDDLQHVGRKPAGKAGTIVVEGLDTTGSLTSQGRNRVKKARPGRVILGAGWASLRLMLVSNATHVIAVAAVHVAIQQRCLTCDAPMRKWNWPTVKGNATRRVLMADENGRLACSPGFGNS